MTSITFWKRKIKKGHILYLTEDTIFNLWKLEIRNILHPKVNQSSSQASEDTNDKTNNPT